MKKISFLFIMFFIVSSLSAGTELSDDTFTITAFKRGGNPTTIVRVTTGVSDSYSFSTETGEGGSPNIFDITSHAAMGKATVSDAIIVEYITNELRNVTITLTFSPFKRYTKQDDYQEGYLIFSQSNQIINLKLDSDSNWLTARYYSPSPVENESFIGIAENCFYKGTTYNLKSMLSSSGSYDVNNAIDITTTKNTNSSIELKNYVIAELSNGSSSNLMDDWQGNILPGIGTRMIVSKRVFSLKDIQVSGNSRFIEGYYYISTVTVTITNGT